MTKKKLTHVVSFKRGGNDWGWVQLYDLSDEQMYAYAMGIPYTPTIGGFPPLLPIDKWCELVDSFSDEERRAYHREYRYFLIQHTEEEA